VALASQTLVPYRFSSIWKAKVAFPRQVILCLRVYVISVCWNTFLQFGADGDSGAGRLPTQLLIHKIRCIKMRYCPQGLPLKWQIEGKPLSIQPAVYFPCALFWIRTSNSVFEMMASVTLEMEFGRI
jgi:hypothetical protein